MSSVDKEGVFVLGFCYLNATGQNMTNISEHMSKNRFQL